MSNKHDSKLKFKDKRRKIIDTSLKKQFKIKECSIFLDKIDVTKFKRIRNFFIIRSLGVSNDAVDERLSQEKNIIFEAKLKKRFKIKECSIFLDKIDVKKFKRIRNVFKTAPRAIPQSPGVSGSSAVSFLKRFTPWLFQPPQLTKESLCDRSNTQKNIRHERWSGVNTHVPANQRKHSKVQQFMNDFQQKKKNSRRIKI